MVLPALQRQVAHLSYILHPPLRLENRLLRPPGSSTVAVPPTSTSCPAEGIARAGVFAHLTLGNQANIVYIVNSSPTGPPVGTLKRYDVATGVKTVIVNLPDALITETQLSANGQWILFIAQSAGGDKLQLVRMDGQGLQTLTCSIKQQSIFNAQWSTNQRSIVFGAGGAPGISTVDLLNVATGALQVEVTHITSVAMYPRTWLDDTRVYLVNQPAGEPPDGLYILDTSRGANQNASSLQKVFDATSPSIGFGCWSFDSSYDGKYLFTSQCIASDSSMGILMKHLYEQPRPLREINPNVSPQFEAIVMRALEKDPANRYQNPTEFLQALTAAASTMTPVDAMDTASPTLANTWQQQPLPPLVQTYSPLSTPVTPYHASNTGEKTRQEPVSQPAPPNPTTPVPVFVPAIPYAATASAQPPPYATVQIPATPAQSRRPIVFAAIIALLIVLIAGISIPIFASGLFGPHNNQQSGVTHGATAPAHNITVTAVGKSNNNTPVVTNTTGQMYTACPTAGTARAAVMPTYTSGNHPNIIYIVNEGTINTPIFGTVKRHDIITGQSIEIIKTANTRVIEAQVSADGQWVLYNAIIGGQDELRLVRVDGQDVQTLLCAPAGQNIFSSQWSANEQYAMFDQGMPTGVPAAYLLNLTNGSLQKELVPAGNQGYMPLYRRCYVP